MLGKSLEEFKLYMEREIGEFISLATQAITTEQVPDLKSAHSQLLSIMGRCDPATMDAPTLGAFEAIDKTLQVLLPDLEAALETLQGAQDAEVGRAAVQNIAAAMAELITGMKHLAGIAVLVDVQAFHLECHAQLIVLSKLPPDQLQGAFQRWLEGGPPSAQRRRRRFLMSVFDTDRARPEAAA